MDQPMMMVIPPLLDRRAKYNEVNGMALNKCSNPESVTPPAFPKKAQYKTAFREENNRKDIVGWTKLWQGGSWKVLNNPNRIKHVVTPASGPSRRALTWDKVGNVNGDMEISAVVRARETGKSKFQLGFHMSGTEVNNSKNAYYLDVFDSSSHSSESKVRIKRFLNGHYKLLGSVDLPFKMVENGWYSVVIKRVDDEITAKVWPYEKKEPSDWQVMAHDRFIDSGKVGFIHFTPEAVNEWAFVGVGTGGKPAPRAPKNLLQPK